MPRKITLTLNSASIDRAIRQLKEYKGWVEEKTQELTRRLAELGAYEATVRFSRAFYDGEKDIEVSVDPIPNGYKITASGEAVCFIEFGAGVYFNGPEPYPERRPAGVSKIGEYGQGKGKQNSWGYYDNGGDLHITHGNPAAMPMYHASREMRQEVERIAREVFG